MTNFNYFDRQATKALSAIRNFLFLFAALCLPQVVSAANLYWTGAINSDWNTAGNWNTGTIPTSADDLYINAGSTPSPVISSGTVTVKSVQVRANRVLTVNSGATLRLTGEVGNPYAVLLMVDGSSVVNNGTIALETSTGGTIAGWMIPSATTTFTNNGTLRINTTFGTAIEAGHNLNNAGQATGHCAIDNNACGKIILIAGNLVLHATPTTTLTNNGLLQITGSASAGGTIINGNSSVFIAGSATCPIVNDNGAVRVNNNPTNTSIFTYTGTFGGTINGIYTNAAATISAGTFTAPNTFSPLSLPAGVQTLYASITSGGCTYIVPFLYTLPPPSITTQPVGVTVCSGTSTTFTAAASNAPTYQWQVNTGGGFTNLSNTAPYSGVTTGTLSISNVSGFNGYQYRCIATNSNGSATSNAATLTVNPSMTRAYVNGAVAASGDGTTWATAFKTLHEGINACGVQEVWVAAGTYKPTLDPFGNATPANPRDKTFYVKDGVEIYGGFAGTETLFSQRNITTNITTLSGDFNDDDVVTGSGSSLSITGNDENAYHVVLASAPAVGGIGVTVDGFTITGGNATNNVLNQITVNGNFVERFHGGGIFIIRGTNSIANNTLIGNFGRIGGSAYLENSTNTVANNTFLQNRVLLEGGAMYAGLGTYTIINNTFWGNAAGVGGGGFTIHSITAIIMNNTFRGNAGGQGSCIHTTGGINTISNNILWQNAPNEYISHNTNNNTFTNNLFQRAASNYTTVGTGNYDLGTGASGNIFAQDPFFFNATDIDGADNIHRTADDGLRLVYGSPALNTGDNAGVAATDITGAARIQNTTVDMGAYEGGGVSNNNNPLCRCQHRHIRHWHNVGYCQKNLRRSPRHSPLLLQYRHDKSSHRHIPAHQKTLQRLH